MKFEMDTQNFEDMKLIISDEEYNGEATDLINDFCFAMSAFFASFAQRIIGDMESVKKLKKVCYSVTDRMIDEFFERNEQDDKSNVDNSKKEELIEKLKDYDFSEEEIAGVVNIIDELGSFELAIEYLKKIGKEHGINFDEDNDN